MLCGLRSFAYSQRMSHFSVNTCTFRAVSHNNLVNSSHENLQSVQYFILQHLKKSKLRFDKIQIYTCFCHTVHQITHCIQQAVITFHRVTGPHGTLNLEGLLNTQQVFFFFFFLTFPQYFVIQSKGKYFRSTQTCKVTKNYQKIKMLCLLSRYIVNFMLLHHKTLCKETKYTYSHPRNWKRSPFYPENRHVFTIAKSDIIILQNIERLTMFLNIYSGIRTGIKCCTNQIPICHISSLGIYQMRHRAVFFYLGLFS